jgi:hypothetical protein
MLPIELRELLNDLDTAPVECDGMCRLITTRLQSRGIAHQVMTGSVMLNDTSIPLHYWILVGDLTVDYRARMWLGDSPLVPHGIFRQDTCAARYEGHEIAMDALHPTIFDMLRMPVPESALKALQAKSREDDSKLIFLGDLVDRTP